MLKPLHALGVMEFALAMADHHPELKDVVTWSGFVAMATREGISIRVIELSRPARLLRLGNRVGIQLSRDLDRTRQTREGMHEMCHFWRDDPGGACLYSDDETLAQPREDFAETFAWYVTSPARVFLEKPEPLSAVLYALCESGRTTPAIIARVTGQPEERVRRWVRGKSKPDAVTAQHLRRYLVALKRQGEARMPVSIAAGAGAITG
jgi:hypothetical protein